MTTQAEINSFVEQIMPFFDPAPIEGDAAHQSWPRLDRGLSDLQDMKRFQHLRGIFGRGGQPFWLRNNGSVANTDATNTKLLTVSTVTGTAEATLHGAFSMLREDMVLEFPPVSSATSQHVVIEYDPIRAADGGDPLLPKVVTSLDTAQGKDFLLLHTVERRPSQLLSDAPATRFRPFVAPTTTYNTYAEFPDPSTLLSGTIAIDRRAQSFYMSMQPFEADEDGNTRTNAWWINLSDPDWATLSINSFYARHDNHTPRILREGKKRTLQGMVTRPDGQRLTTSWPEGWNIATLPTRDRPSRIWKLPMVGSGQAPSGTGGIEIYPNGAMRAYSGGSSMWWVSLDGITWWVD